MTQSEKQRFIGVLDSLIKYPEYSPEYSAKIYFTLMTSNLKNFKPNFEDPDDKYLVNKIFSCIILAINNKNLKGGRGSINNDLFRLSELMFIFNKLKDQVSHFINIEVIFSEPKSAIVSYYIYLKVNVVDKIRYLVFRNNEYFETIQQTQYDELKVSKYSLTENQIKILPLTTME